MRRTFYTLFEKSIDLINSAIYVVIALAVLGFMWGIVKILFSRENEIAKKEGREFMMYGILTLFVMTSFWGLVNLLNGTLDIQPEEVEEYKGDVKTTKDSDFDFEYTGQDATSSATSEWEYNYQQDAKGTGDSIFDFIFGGDAQQ